MNERQAASGSDGEEPDAARTPDDDKGFELPPPPAPGALWASLSVSSGADGSTPVDGDDATPRKSADRFAGSTRPISAMPSAGAARATVPGALTGDDAGLRALTWPTGGSKVYGGPAAKEDDTAPAPQMSQPDRPEPDPGQPGPDPSPIPPGPDPSPIPPGPGPSPVPPGPGPSPVPGPPQPIFPPPPMISSTVGLPAYTMPPLSPQPPTIGAAPHEPQTSVWQPAFRDQESDQTIAANSFPSWNQPNGTPYGVGSLGAVREPFGGSAGDVDTPATRQETFGQSRSAVPPQQRGEGTVYGAQNPADMTMPVTMNAIDNSGSLTGHILAQGWDRGEDTGRRSNVKVGIAMVAVLLFLVGMSLLFLFTAGDAFTDMVNGVFNKE